MGKLPRHKQRYIRPLAQILLLEMIQYVIETRDFFFQTHQMAENFFLKFA